MDAAGTPGLREQRRDNALLLNALHHAVPRIEAGELGIGREVLAALPDLLSLHRFCALRVLAGARRAALTPQRTKTAGQVTRRALPGLLGHRRTRA